MASTNASLVAGEAEVCRTCRAASLGESAYLSMQDENIVCRVTKLPIACDLPVAAKKMLSCFTYDASSLLYCFLRIRGGR
jgi:hypothetical protein